MSNGNILAGLGVLVIVLAIGNTMRFYPPGEGYAEERRNDVIAIAGTVIGIALIIVGAMV